MTHRHVARPGEHSPAAPSRFAAVPRIGADRAAGFVAGLQRGAGNASVARWMTTARPTVALQRSADVRSLARVPIEPPPSSDALREAGRRALEELWDELHRQTEVAADHVRGVQGDKNPRKRPSGTRRGPRGSQRATRNNASWVKDRLRQIVKGGGPDASRAADLLKGIEGVEDDIQTRNRDLGRAHWPAEPRPEKPGPGKQNYESPKKAPPTTTTKPPTTAKTPQVPPGVAASAAKEAGRLRGLAGRFVRGVGSVAGKVAGPLLAALQMIDAIGLILTTETAVRGGGFTFHQQIGEASALAADVEGLVRSYRDSRFHDELAELVQTAVRNDAKYSQYDATPAKYWGTVELSEFCLEAQEAVFAHMSKCSDLLDHLRRIDGDVSDRLEACNAILADPAAMAALSVPTSVPLARVFTARNDLQRIDELLRPARAALAAHLKIAKHDHRVIHDNILNYGWALEDARVAVRALTLVVAVRHSVTPGGYSHRSGRYP